MKRRSYSMFVVLLCLLPMMMLNGGVIQAAGSACGGWSVVKSPSPGSNVNVLTAVAAVSATDAWAVGYYINSDMIFQRLIERWDGTQWSVVQSPSPGSLNNEFDGV